MSLDFHKNTSFSIPSILDLAIRELDCTRSIVAKLHGLSSSDLSRSVFSVIFESRKPHSLSVKPIVKDISCSVLDFEFPSDDLDFISIACTSLDSSLKCINHLHSIEASFIINQLLHIDSYIWGILSFQFSEIPSFYQDGSLSSDAEFKIKYYKHLISQSL